MSITPHRILREAIAAVPAVRYAAGVAGIASSIAIVASFKLGPAVAVLGVVVMLMLMAALLAFARAAGIGATDQPAQDEAALGSRAIPIAGIMMVWVFTLLICATGIMVFTVTFFGAPRSWQELVAPSLAGQGPLLGGRSSTSVEANMGNRPRDHARETPHHPR